MYYLVFLTQHPAGVWAFHEALSLANQRHFNFTHRGQLDLDPDGDRTDHAVQLLLAIRMA